MNFSNYHSHCVFCDGHAPMEDFVKQAIANEMKKYGFSSHGPIPFDTHWNMKEDSFPYYTQEFNRLKEKYQQDIDLFVGMEVDFIKDCSDINNGFYKENTFDYLIGSIHYLDKISDNNYVCIDGNFADFESGFEKMYGSDIRLYAERYFEISAMMIEQGGFDIVGHFDKVSYHGSKYKEFNPKAAWYEQLVGETLQLVKRKNLILEINTKSLKDKLLSFPNFHFFPLINELEIPVTVNSDCHYPQKMTDGFDETYQQLKSVGFKTMHQLINGKWEPVAFNENGLCW